MEWLHSGSPHPKKFRMQKSAGKFLASISWDQDGIFLIDYLPEGQTINTVLLISPGAMEGLLMEKCRGNFTKGVLFLQDNALAHQALATQKKLAYLGFWCLDHPPFLQIWSCQTTTCSLDWKNNWKFVIFHLTQRSLLLWRPGWMDNFLNFFWVACKS